MTPLEVVAGALALFCAGLIYLSWLALNRALYWRDRYHDLLKKPLSFWQHREVMRQVAKKVRLESFRAVPPVDLPEGVVKMRRLEDGDEPVAVA